MAPDFFGARVSSPNDRMLLLTAEERRALSLAATGLVVADVAAAMGASLDAVRELHDSAIWKLGARSKLEAVFIAARNGELDFPP